jgi:hypothetical protein
MLGAPPQGDNEGGELVVSVGMVVGDDEPAGPANAEICSRCDSGEM